MLLMLVTSTSTPTVLAVKFHENLHAKINCFFTFQFGWCLVNLAFRKCQMICFYVSVRKVSRKFGFKEVSDDEDWSLYWTDYSVALERVMDMKKYQVRNLHFVRVPTSSGNHGKPGK